jgi:hypothetical protein
MSRDRRHRGVSLALAVVIALATGTARAGILEIDLTIDGASPIPILQGGPFDTAANPDKITVDTGLLNAAIAAAGFPQLTFSALGAQSNNPGVASGANLTQTGTASLSQGSGPLTFTVDTFQSDFTTPAGPVGGLQSSASHTFTNTAAGDSQTFQSWFDQTNTNSKTTPSPLIAFVSPSLNGNPPNQDSGGFTTPLTPLGPVTPGYSLVNETVVTLTASPGAASSPVDQFQGSTVVTAVPEPTSFVAMFTALPLMVFWRRRRRRLRSIA